MNEKTHNIIKIEKRSEPANYRNPLFVIKVLFCCFSILTFLNSASFAQEESQVIAPPPLKVMTKDEKKQLEAETNVKKHTVLALELMDARLVKSESLSSRQQYREMYDELGGFHAILDDTLDYLNKRDTGSGKVLDNYKRLEMSLRKFAPRIELIRRDLPIKYESYVRKLIIYVREARSKAIAPLFDDYVVPNANKGN